MRQTIIDRLKSGQEITVDRKKETAFVAKYTKYEVKIPYEWVDVLESCGIIECDSGNLETGERHYILTI
ncbi:MAG TPA: hypothetical protein VGN64_14320 [Dyadobacter sp.]|jgi:hypothetical protein|nr:hypothetical protein [Dyadobacter sp.]